MIDEFKGKKFQTRDKRCNADIVQHRTMDTDYPFWVVLTPKDHPSDDKCRSYTRNLKSNFNGDKSCLDLVEMGEYDWPLWSLVFAWNKKRPVVQDLKVFAGVNDGRPETFFFTPDGLQKETWSHAELAPLPLTGLYSVSP